jgi:hypothetical protein
MFMEVKQALMSSSEEGTLHPFRFSKSKGGTPDTSLYLGSQEGTLDSTVVGKSISWHGLPANMPCQPPHQMEDRSFQLRTTRYPLVKKEHQ